LLKEEKR